MSLAWHLVLFTAVLWQMAPEYRFFPPTVTPAPTQPTMEAEIVTMARLEPPKVPPPTPKPATPPPLPTPLPPRPAPQPQAAPETAPPRPKTPEPAKPAPPKPSPLPAPTPTPLAPAPRPAPAPQAAVAKAIPAPAKPAPAAAPSRPSPLNIHKAAQAPPANVPTLPMAPAAGAKTGGSAPPAGAASGPESASRLKGINPYPYGTMPSGGPGLRGTLVGCANADAVNLSAAERSHCNERFGEDMSHAPALDPLSRAKRAQFDKAVDHEDAERRYRAAEPHALGAPFDAGGTIPHGPPPASPGGPIEGQYPPK